MCSRRRFIRRLDGQQANDTRAKREKKKKSERSKDKNLRNTATAETKIAAEIATGIVGTVEVQHAAGHEPFDFEIYTGVDKIVKVTGGVLERQSIRINELLGDLDMDLGRQAHEGAGRVW